MPKKAYLVDYSIRTRVIVNIPEDKIEDADNNELCRERIGEAAEKRLMSFVSDGDNIFNGNLEDIREDTECPFGALEEDLMEDSVRVNALKEYREASQKLREATLESIRGIFRELLPGAEKKVDLSSAIRDNLTDGIYKYYTPKDYPCNFILEEFGITEDEKMEITGSDVDGVGTYTFSEYDFTTDELDEIRTQLATVLALIEDGTVNIDENGKIEIK